MELQPAFGGAFVGRPYDALGDPVGQRPQGGLGELVGRSGCLFLQFLAGILQLGEPAAPAARLAIAELQRFRAQQGGVQLAVTTCCREGLSPGAERGEVGQELVLGVAALRGAGGQMGRLLGEVGDLRGRQVRRSTGQHPVLDQVPVGAEGAGDRAEMVELDPGCRAPGSPDRPSRGRRGAHAAAPPSASRTRPRTPPRRAPPAAVAARPRSGAGSGSAGRRSAGCRSLRSPGRPVPRLPARGGPPERPLERQTFSNFSRRRSRSSAPAFSVKVTAAMFVRRMPSRSTSVVTRVTNERVLPEPAPASTNWFSWSVLRDPVPSLLVGERHDSSSGSIRAISSVSSAAPRLCS